MHRLKLLFIIPFNCTFNFSEECGFFQPYNSAKVPIYLVTASLRKEKATIYALHADVLIWFFFSFKDTVLKKNMKIFYTVLYNNEKYHGHTFNIHICHLTIKKSYLQKMLFCWFGPLHLIIICLIWVSPFLDLVVTSYLGCFDYVLRTSSIRLVSGDAQPLLVGSRQDDFSAVSAIRRTAALRAPFLAS